MKFKLLLFLFCCTISTVLKAQSFRSGSVTITSDKKNIKTENKSVTGLMDVTSKKIKVTVDVAGFFFDSDLRKKHFDGSKGMDISVFPTAEFEGVIETDEDLTIVGKYNVTVSGKLTIKGKTIDYVASGTILKSDEGYTIDATFLIDREKLELTKGYPKMLDDKIKVDFKATI